ncbi:NAD(P)-dependent dehydrogenase (short-subunit alcohol dehydrogenase family) [Bradyrhizobium sp. USDA 4369]
MNGERSKTALVTGAAGGIGQALTRRLIGDGHHVVMLDINQSALDACKAKLGERVTTLACDVTSSASVEAAVRAFSERFVTLDVLVNNAGCIVPGPFLRAEPNDIEKQMQINLLGPMRVLTRFLPLVPAGGSVVNVVSMAGILPLKDSAAYTAGKFGLRGLTLTLALELKGRGIKVSGVYPSAVDTPMLRMEARSGGSPLNFIAEPLSPEKVVDAIMLAIKQGKMEYYIPYGDGLLSRISAFVPWLLPHLLPHFERKGAVGQQRYIAKTEP